MYLKIFFLVVLYFNLMNINLDQIFGSNIKQLCSDSDKESYKLSSGLMTTKSQANHYKFNVPIFDGEDETQDIGATPYRSNTLSVFSGNNSLSSSNTNKPGQRLYYQSKMHLARKRQQIQRKNLEKLKQDQKGMTFRPKINKNSQKIIQNRGKFSYLRKKQVSKFVSTNLKKQQQGSLECTFKPQKISKPSPSLLRNKSKGQVFEALFQTHKFRKAKQRMKKEWQEEEENQKKKKLTKNQFESFLNRSKQFLTKVEKKKELLLTTSSQYDLKTGKKLFSPKINNSPKKKTAGLFSDKGKNNKTQSILWKEHQIQSIPKKHEIKTKPIFQKNYKYEQINEEQKQEEYINPFKKTYYQNALEKSNPKQSKYLKYSKNFDICSEFSKSQKDQPVSIVSQDISSFNEVNQEEIPSQRVQFFRNNGQEEKEEEFISDQLQNWEFSQQSMRSEENQDRGGTKYQDYQGRDSRFKLQNH